MPRSRARSSARRSSSSTASRSGAPIASITSSAGSPPAGGETPRANSPLAMSLLRSRLKPASDEYRGNADAMRAMVADLRARHAQVRQGGDAAARERHVGRGKLLPRERIGALLDADSEFLEL